MTTLSILLRYEMFFLLAALAVIILYRLLTGQINTAGLLADKAPGSERPNGKRPKSTSGVISPGRVQMLVATLLVSIYLVTKVVQTNAFPDIPREYLLALGGSHGLYLAGKVYGMLTEKLESAASRIAERTKQ